MSLKKKNIYVLILFIFAIFSLFFFSGCNLFSIFHTSGLGTFNSTLDKAEASYKNGDYEKAMEYYQKAIDANPQSSEARVGYVNSLAKVRFVDFLYIAQEMSKTNFDAFDLLNDPIVKNNIVGGTGVFQKTIDYLLPIQNRECDGVIPYNDGIMNLQLAVSFSLRALMKMADTDNDGVIGSTNDFIQIIPGPSVQINSNVLNFNEISSNMSKASTNTNTGISAGSDPLSIFMSATDANALTNLTVGTDSDYRYFLQSIHDSIAMGLNLLHIASLGFDYLGKAIGSINLIGQKYKGNALISDSVNGIQNFYNEFAGYSSDIDAMAQPFNDFHKQITGGYAYSGGVVNYQISSFQSHMDYIRANGNQGGLMDLLFLGGGHLDITNAMELMDIMTNAIGSYTNSDFTGLLGTWITNLGF